MVSLFLGELVRMTAPRRVLLIALSCAWVFMCNVARAATLVTIGGCRGFDALHRAHDAVGTVVMIGGLVGIIGIAFLLRRPTDVAQHAHSAGTLPFTSALETFTGIVWLLLVFGATELWYRAHEHHLVARPSWRVAWPDDAKAAPIAESTRAILRYNDASSATWDAANREWWGFYARWEPHRTAAQLVRSHSPEICLPAIGRDFEGELAPVRVNSNAISLPFRCYRFTQNGKPLFVFVCIQEDKFSRDAETGGEWSTRGRLVAAWSGRRNLGQRLLELALIGADAPDNAARALTETVSEIVRPATTD